MRAGVQRTAGDLAGHQRLRQRHPLPRRQLARTQRYATRLLDLVRALGTLGVWVRLHYVYPVSACRCAHSADERARRAAVSGYSVPACAAPRCSSACAGRRTPRTRCGASSAGARSGRDLTLRSTFIVGFPGETEAEFEQLLAWLDAAQLDRVGCFQVLAGRGRRGQCDRAQRCPRGQGGALSSASCRRRGRSAARAWRHASGSAAGC